MKLAPLTPARPRPGFSEATTLKTLDFIGIFTFFYPSPDVPNANQEVPSRPRFRRPLVADSSQLMVDKVGSWATERMKNVSQGCMSCPKSEYRCPVMG